MKCRTGVRKLIILFSVISKISLGVDSNELSIIKIIPTWPQFFKEIKARKWFQGYFSVQI